MELNILTKIQTELVAPKGQRNNFGNYNYRSAEDILNAVKPLLKETNSILTISDEMVEVGGRIYVKATATFTSLDIEESVTGFAREPESQKGMSESQITGTASSYARKYALNGLFAIDDTKDADTNEHKVESEAKYEKKVYSDEERGLMQVINDMKKATTQEDRIKYKDEGKTFAKSDKQIKWLTNEWTKLG